MLPYNRIRHVRDDQSGSALVEATFAAAILIILAVLILPVFLFNARIAVKNDSKVVAQGIAAQHIESIKSLAYADAGTVGGNPAGSVTSDSSTVVDGVTFTVTNRIRFVDDPTDGTGLADSDPRDYKSATTTVTWQALGGTDSYKVTTNISKESRDQIAVGGNILVNVRDAAGTPLADATARILSGPSGPLSDFTAADGSALFAMLPESAADGDYSLAASLDGWVVRPDIAVQTTTVTQGQQRTVDFVMDRPGTLRVELVDDGGALITRPSSIVLRSPGTPDLQESGTDGEFTVSGLYPGNWEITPSAASYDYTDPPATAVLVAGQTTTIRLTLHQRANGNLHITVLDATDQSPLADAAVTVTNPGTGESFVANTNVQGIVEIPLELATWSIETQKAGYVTDLRDVVISGPGNTFVDIPLSRAVAPVGTVIIGAFRQSTGAPRSNIPTVLRGPSGNDVFIRTGADGLATYTDVAAGTYTSYIWSGGWRFPRTITVSAGQTVREDYSW